MGRELCYNKGKLIDQEVPYGKISGCAVSLFLRPPRPDQLGTAVIIAALVLSVLASILGWSLLSLLSLVIWAWALYRWLSRQHSRARKGKRVVSEVVFPARRAGAAGAHPL